MALEKTWRWFGPSDIVTLEHLKQMGVEGVVTALHHIPNGEVWSVSEIQSRKQLIEKMGLRWSVVESLPVSEIIKTRSKNYDQVIENYKQSIINLSLCGIDTVCYNFMPVLDWVRTDLHYRLASGGEVMLFDHKAFVAFDVFILQRKNATLDYSKQELEKASEWFNSISKQQADDLAYNIIVKTQAFINGAIPQKVNDYKKAFLDYIQIYQNIKKENLQENLALFLQQIIPIAVKYNINMCIHPDDPPFNILGLPRIVSTIDDLEWICNQYNVTQNGITFCTGSLAARKDNNLLQIIEKLGSRIHFSHLRNVMHFNNSFYESGHIEGNVNMFLIVKALLEEQKKRINNKRKDFRLPYRPDHGIKIISDFNEDTNPGYPTIGRFAGLIEINAIQQTLLNLIL